ncbi:MAG TPA: glycosyltransferase [Planctomycetota bacterium]|nr:glycosyltransferase [Planctomycetota bacterium]
MSNEAIAVLFILPGLKHSGPETVVLDIATRIRAHGFAPSVLCLEDERESVGQALSKAGIPVAGLRQSRRRAIAAAKAIVKQLPKKRPLIVHSHLFHANLAARLAMKRLDETARRGVHLINTVHVAERRFRPWHFALDRMTADFARVEVCVSQAVAKFQQEQTGLPESFFRVIENGIDLSRFSPPKTAPSGHARVLSVGRLDAQKDYPTLLRAWKLVQAAAPEATLEIAGDGPDGDALKSLAESLKLNNVTFSGFVTDVPERMRKATLYVQTSAWEGFGLTVAEAMATGLPVIVSDADSLPELVTDEKTGLVFNKGKHERLAKLILKLINEPTRANELGAAALAEARRRFNVERMVEEHARLYRELLETT